MHRLRRGIWVVAGAISVAACTPSKGSGSADSVQGDTVPRTATTTGVGAETVSAAARPAASAARPVVDTAPPAARAGGPPHPPARARSSGCRGPAVSVTVKASALGSSNDAAALRSLSTELLAPVRDLVGAPSISPAIRAFRVTVRDSSALPRVMAQLRASPKVETVERDECAVMIGR